MTVAGNHLLGSTDRRILRLAVPALGTLAAEPLYRLVDTAIVGRLGTEELGGLAVATSVLALVVVTSNSFLAYGTTERVARRLGAGETSDAANVGVQAMWIAAIGSIPAVVLVAFAADPLARILGAEGDVLGHAVDYLRISALGLPFVLLALAVQGVQRGATDFTTPLIILIASNALNVAIEPVLVFGFDLGVPGAAWSTVVAQAFAGVMFGVTVRRHLRAATTIRPNRSEMAPLLSAGRHLLLRAGSMLVVFAGATAVAARIDPPTLAAHQIVNAMFLVLALTLDALAIPAQTLVADELGRTDGRPRLIAERVVRLSLGLGVALAVVLGLLAPLLARAFSNDPAVIDRATHGFRYLAVGLIPGAIAFAHDGILIGAGDYRFIGRAALAYLVAMVPIALLVLASPGLGIAGVWLALLTWMIMRAMVNHVRTSAILPR